MSATVSQWFIEGIKEGRVVFATEGLEHAADHIQNLSSTIKGFSASSSVGQMLRGELSFWKHQVQKLDRAAPKA